MTHNVEMRVPGIDDLLDRTVLGGFSKVGYRVRSRGWDPLPRMDGQVVLVTGANSGLGFAAASGFAELGAQVWLVVRDAARGEEAASRIASGDVVVGVCDLSRLGSVREFAAQVSHVDVLVHNAGVLTETRERSADGIELTLATNVIGPFLLTALLVPALRASAAARVITVSSGGMYTARLDVDALGSEVGARAYAQTKRAQVVLSEMWAARLRGTGIVVHSMHPGWVDTPGLRDSLPGFYRGARRVLRTPAEGADTIVWLGAADEPGRVTGAFWHDRRQRPTHMLPGTRESDAERERLWAECVRLSGAAPGT